MTKNIITDLSFAKEQNIRRILMLEKFIMVPLKVIVIVFSYYFLTTLSPSDATKYYFFQLRLYIAANVFFMLTLLGSGSRQIRPVIVKVSSFFLTLIDNLYLSFMIYFTGGLESELYLLYLGLFVRNAINFPEKRYQQTINIILILFYVGAIHSVDGNFGFLTDEVFILRILTLFFVSICCWGIYILIDRDRKRLTDMREKNIRSEKLNIAGKLGAQIAHELKNPLGIMNNAVYLIKKNIHGDPEKILHHADIIQGEIKRSDRIISELLDYSRLAGGKIDRVDLNGFIESFIANNNFQGIEFIPCEGIPDLFIDKNQFGQVLYHLMSNAKESVETAGGKGTIVVKTFLCEGNLLGVEIDDTGTGVDKKILEKIFVPFFTTKENHIGLGLSIVKNILRTYDGKVFFENKSTGGFKVDLKFPVRTTV